MELSVLADSWLLHGLYAAASRSNGWSFCPTTGSARKSPFIC